MRKIWLILCVQVAALLFFKATLIAQRSNTIVATTPIYVPDISRQNDPLPDGILGWNGLELTTNLTADASQADFLFLFTNASREKVSILGVLASCECTTEKLPSLPWTIPAGGDGQIPVTVNIEDRTGTFFNSIDITTDKGKKELLLQINIQPPVLPTMTDADRANAIAAAKINRQAVFHGVCATCHVQHGENKYGGALYEADCAICHETAHRASFVPDLHNLKVPTSSDFWETWVAHGKPGTFMPAFSQKDGGPLSDMQIASLAVYLDQAIPARIPGSTQ